MSDARADDSDDLARAPALPQPGAGVPPVPDTPLAQAVVEVEAHVAGQGWDQPAQLFALVETADLVRREPALAAAMGLTASDTGLTPVQQDELPSEQSLELALEQITWPAEVAGCAAVVERLVLPPDAEVPEDPAEAAAFAANHPARQELRLAAGTTRDGATFCAMRFRSHDDDRLVVTGDDLVPGLLERLQATLETSPDTSADPDAAR